jgi:hypothetical protein
MSPILSRACSMATPSRDLYSTALPRRASATEISKRATRHGLRHSFATDSVNPATTSERSRSFRHSRRGDHHDLHPRAEPRPFGVCSALDEPHGRPRYHATARARPRAPYAVVITPCRSAVTGYQRTNSHAFVQLVIPVLAAASRHKYKLGGLDGGATDFRGA